MDGYGLSTFQPQFKINNLIEKSWTPRLPSSSNMTFSKRVTKHIYCSQPLQVDLSAGKIHHCQLLNGANLKWRWWDVVFVIDVWFLHCCRCVWLLISLFCKANAISDKLRRGGRVLVGVTLHWVPIWEFLTKWWL